MTFKPRTKGGANSRPHFPERATSSLRCQQQRTLPALPRWPEHARPRAVRSRAISLSFDGHKCQSAATDPAAALQALGGAKVIVITASGGKTIPETFKGLRPGGLSIDLGVGPEPIEVTSMDLIFGERKVAGSLTGNPATADTTLRFSALGGVSAMIETVPLDQAAAAYAKMMAGQARFRIVLVTKNGNGQPGQPK